MNNNKMNKEFESKLWNVANQLRGNISAEEYMHIVFGILFLKHMSDKFNNAIGKIKEDYGEESGFEDNLDILTTDYEVPFIVPEKANWNYIAPFATDSAIGEKIDNAFRLLEERNSDLKGMFSKNYSREELDQSKLGKVVSEFSNLDLTIWEEDIVGRTYEYFLGNFFKKKGSKGGEFYTPTSIVKLMVEIVNPTKGKLYDPTSGTGGMLIQARKHLISLGKDKNFLEVYGQESQLSTWKLSRINLLIHGFSLDSIHMGDRATSSFKNDLHKGEKFDYILANPPFNLKNWGLEELQEDERFAWGTPPKNNANYAFLSHMLFKLKDSGVGATVLANGSLAASTNAEKKIRKNFIDNNFIDAIITLPDKLFYTTGIPACIWVFRKNTKNKNILMIDCSKLDGEMVSKTLRTLTKEEINKVSEIYKKHEKGEDINILGLAKTITSDELLDDYVLIPSRYIEEEEEVIDKDQIKKEIKDLTAEINNLMDTLVDEIPKVKEAIKKVLKKD